MRQFGRDGHRGRGLITGIATRVDRWPFGMWKLWTESQNGKVDT